MFVLHKNGHLEAVKSTFDDKRVKTAHLKLNFDEDEPPIFMPSNSGEDEPPIFMPSTRALPANGLMKVKLGYDDSFRNDFSSVSDAETYLEAMMTHVQAHFCLDSLGKSLQKS